MLNGSIRISPIQKILLREVKSEDNVDLFPRFEGSYAQKVRSKGPNGQCCDNAPAHQLTLITNFLTKTGILSNNHSPHPPDLAPCDLYFLGKLHLAMKRKRSVARLWVFPLDLGDFWSFSGKFRGRNSLVGKFSGFF